MEPPPFPLEPPLADRYTCASLIDNVQMTFLAMTKGKQAPFVAPRPVDDSPEAKREAEKKLVKASREFHAGVKVAYSAYRPHRHPPASCFLTC